MRNTQAVVCYKSGFGKPVIVVDCEFPEFIIYPIRKDIEVPASLMKWRRGGKVKDSMTEAKWTGKDVSDVLDIAIEVPLGFDGKPENLVKLIQRLSRDEKEALEKKGKPILKQPSNRTYNFSSNGKRALLYQVKLRRGSRVGKAGHLAVNFGGRRVPLISFC